MIGSFTKSEIGRPTRDRVKKVSDRKRVFVWGKKALVLNMFAKSRVLIWFMFWFVIQVMKA